MRQSVASLDEVAMSAMGFDRVTIATFRNIVRIVGKATDTATVPDIAADVDTTTTAVTTLQLLTVALQLAVKELEAEGADLPLPAPDRALQRRADELQAELERVTVDNARLARSVEELQAGQQQIGIEQNRISRRITDLENGVN